MKNTKWIAAAAITWAIASPAAAQSSYAEMQIDAREVADYLRAELTQHVAGMCPQPVSSLLCEGDACYLDHVEVSSSGTFVWGAPIRVRIDDRLPLLTTTQLQFVQPITILTKTEACVMDVDCPRDEYAREITVHVVASLRASLDSICVAPVGFQESWVPPDALPSALPEVCMPFELDAVAGLVENALVPAGAALGANEAATRIAVRVEYLRNDFDALPLFLQTPINTARRTIWQAFLNRSISTAPGLSSGFGVLITEGLLEQATTGRIIHQLTDRPGTELLERPTSTFSHYLGPDGHLSVAAYVDQTVPVCPNTIGVEVDVSMPMTFDDGRLELNGLLQWNVIDSDVFACTMAPGGVGAPLTTVIAAIVASEYGPDPALFAASDCDVAEVDEGISMRCSTEIDDIAVRHGASYLFLRFQGATASAAGLTLHGTASGGGPGLADASLLAVDGAFSYGIQGDVCRGGFIGFEGSIRASGARICDVQIANDEHGVYRAYDIDDTTAAIEFPTFASQLCETSPGSGAYVVCPAGVPSALDHFWSNPYGAEVVVLTTRGTIGLRLDEPVSPSSADEQSVLTSWRAQQVLCHELQTGLFGIPGLFDWRWHVNPPDYRVKTVIDGRVRDLGSVALTDVRLREVSALTARGSLQTSRVRMVLEATANVDLGRAGRHRVGISVPLSVDLQVESDGVRIQAMRSLRTVSVPVTFDRTAPEALRGASFDLALGAGAITITSRH